MFETVPVLLDTDIGSDIDDAVALSYLLRQPRCELLGITTVTGDVQRRASLAEIVCRAAGRGDIPIHCGRRDVLLYGHGQPHVPQFEAVAHLAGGLDRAENSAVEFLRTAIRSRPGEVVLLTIGPFSNAAILFAVDPEIPSLLKGIVSMGGRFFEGPPREWNVTCDPVSAAMVYNANRQSHTTFGLDVTMKCRLTKSEVAERFKGQPLETILLMANAWFERAEHMTFHDPLAAACIFAPEICGYSQGRICVSVSTHKHLAGFTKLLADETGPDLVASSVDVDAFFTEFFGVLAGR